MDDTAFPRHDDPGRVTGPIAGLLDAVATGDGVASELFTPDAVLDATVPHWRFSRRGAGAVAAELSSWYQHPGRLDRVDVTAARAARWAVEIDLSWEQDGVPHAAHQLHLLALDDGRRRVSADTVWCGGRWPAGLLAEMAAAEMASSEMPSSEMTVTA